MKLLHRMRGGTRYALLILALSLAASVLTVSGGGVAAAATANSSTSCGTFTGSVAKMEKWLSCKHIHYDVVTSRGGLATPTTQPDATPDAGGPSCRWQKHYVMKFCYQRGVAHMVCARYYADGTAYPQHCGPLSQYTMSNGTSLWHYVASVFTSHAAKACYTVGGGGAVGGVIVKLAGGGALGIVGGLAGGCVGGIYSSIGTSDRRAA